MFLFQDDEKEILRAAPRWMLRAIPADATRDDSLLSEIRETASKPEQFDRLFMLLSTAQAGRSYVPAVNLSNAFLYRRWNALLLDPPSLLPVYAYAHLPHTAELRVLRRLAKHPDRTVRSHIWHRLRNANLHEVALPRTTGEPWDETGWLAGLRATKRASTPRRKVHFLPPAFDLRTNYNLPRLETVGELREALGIVSSRQLGWFLLATASDPDADASRPYHRFFIPKHDGSPREICAPCPQLRRVQRNILDFILHQVPVHDAAHGFVRGRSTVTNAGPHVGKELVLKFDLVDFFPTVHFARVAGLFTGLGYPGNGCLWSTDDSSRRVAGTLARLCVYVPDPARSFLARCPQGAPTSPGIANQVCRRLDARCAGLAVQFGGDYTRYADDLTFSFARGEVPVGRFRWWVDQICQQEGFAVHPGKFRVVRRSRRQAVTGLVVNDKLRIPREMRRRFRARLHDAQRNGVKAAARGWPGFLGWMHGFAAYLHMVDPVAGRKALAAVQALKETES